MLLMYMSPAPVHAQALLVGSDSDTGTISPKIEYLQFKFNSAYQPSDEELAILDAADEKAYLQSRQEEIDKFYAQLKHDYDRELSERAEVERLVAFLRRQGSPVASYAYAKQIIDLSRANGADYRIIVAISGIESGFCRVNYKGYNCFGYLNGVRYGSYTQAFNALVPAIARQYARPYGTNFEALAKAYGMHNYTYHAGRMHAFYSALK